MDQLPVKLTNKAVAAVKKYNDKNYKYLNIGVRGGGCTGFEYDLGFSNEKDDYDKEYEQDGVKILVDKKAALYLVGTELDYVDEINRQGFQFNNPNATKSCGCGQSFSV